MAEIYHHADYPNARYIPLAYRIAGADDPGGVGGCQPGNHADTLKYLALYLEALGHTVVTAKTMARALEALPGAGRDVLIPDIGLPDGDGWELLRTVRLPHPVYAIAMSGFGLNADHIRSQDVGYRHHLLKPFMPGELDAAPVEAAQEATVRA